jgi:hypothetical protein
VSTTRRVVKIIHHSIMMMLDPIWSIPAPDDYAHFQIQIQTPDDLMITDY